MPIWMKSYIIDSIPMGGLATDQLKIVFNIPDFQVCITASGPKCFAIRGISYCKNRIFMSLLPPAKDAATLYHKNQNPEMATIWRLRNSSGKIFFTKSLDFRNSGCHIMNHTARPEKTFRNRRRIWRVYAAQAAKKR